MLLPIVMLFNVPLLLVRTGVASLLVRVPPLMVPEREFRPPVPNKPVLPISSVLPVLSKLPVTFNVEPAVRLKRPVANCAALKLPFKFNVPAFNAMLPRLVHATAPEPMVCVLPLKLIVPSLTSDVLGVMLRVAPAATLMLPVLALLVKLVGLMVSVPAVTFMAPLLTTSVP